MILEVFAKVVFGAKEVRVGKVQEREVFRKVVLKSKGCHVSKRDTSIEEGTNLNWCSCENDAFFDVQCE